MLALIALVVMAYVFFDQLRAGGMVISSLQMGFLLTCAILIFVYRRRGTDL